MSALFDSPAEVRDLLGGAQRVYRFDNGYGASVVRHDYSYGGPAGLWELAVIDATTGDLVYTTPVTSDVEGYLSTAQVERLLRMISRLQARS
jgi:hypothetical protein